MYDVCAVGVICYTGQLLRTRSAEWDRYDMAVAQPLM